MNDLSFLGLIQNAGLLLGMALVFDVGSQRLRNKHSTFDRLLLGVILGGIGIVLMLTPWVFRPGIIFDTRTVLLGVSGLFFGGLPTLVAMGITAVFRLSQGGAAAWVGVASIVATGTIGIAWRKLRRKPLAEIGWRELYLLGLIVHIAMLALMLGSALGDRQPGACQHQPACAGHLPGGHGPARRAAGQPLEARTHPG
jgi:phosphoglycerol transferase MdoB-like AlkP superfamily enzyme